MISAASPRRPWWRPVTAGEQLESAGERVSLLAEAVDEVPIGRQPVRPGLMARLAVVRSHHVPDAEGEASTGELAIARAVDRRP